MKWPTIDCRQRIKEFLEKKLEAGVDVSDEFDKHFESDTRAVDLFYDLEYNPNAPYEMSLWTFAKLVQYMATTPSELLFGSPRITHLTFETIRKELLDYRDKSGLTEDQLGEQIGWNIADILQGNLKHYSMNAGMDSSIDIAEFLEKNWLDALTALCNELNQNRNITV